MHQRIEHLRAESMSVVVDVSGGIPVILHWGAALDHVPSSWQEGIRTYGTMDVVAPISMVPMNGDGFPGRPGLQVHRRGGRHWSPRFRAAGHAVTHGENCSMLESRAIDEVSESEIVCRLRLEDDGVLTASAEFRNNSDSPVMLNAFTITLPIAGQATELAVFAGRWSRELQLQRFSWPYGAWTSENRVGRTSHEHPPYLFALETAANEWSGQAWGIHAAWSGNHSMFAEWMPDGRRYVQAGELFHPGEMCVYSGESLSAVDVVGVYSDLGLNGVSRGFHREARRRLPHNVSRPRPVHLNTWEAVYFAHDEARLRSLADVAASVGVERFVLDDGWFGGRRNDRTGLGDWTVSREVYPDGLAPLVSHVRELGMEFGIWVEPEMANPDSDMLRAHPEWALITDGYEPVMGRRQHVIDLTNIDAFEHVLGALDDLLAEHDISYVKWDMNRWHVQGSRLDGTAATHAQTVAVYAMLDELRRRHPLVEFESCASGGGRIDHEILRRTERVWTSDCNDALERQYIQRGASMIIPAEVMGSHIGPARAHTTGRRLSMAMRGVTAMFGHMGVEADVTAMGDDELSDLRHVIGVHKRFRSLIHTGESVRFETFDLTSGAALSHGVIATDRSEAILAYVQLASVQAPVAPAWRIPGLDPERDYVVRMVPLTREAVPVPGTAVDQPAWLRASLADEPQSMSGAFLRDVGLVPPVMWPESAVLVHLSGS
ncbi:MAG: alpha-galactosidase [Ilumatobacteraceae bacterium]